MNSKVGARAGLRHVSVALLALLLSVRPTPSIQAQTAAARVSVAAGATVKSLTITLTAGSDVVVRMVEAGAPGTPFVRVFMHTEDGALVASDDPESTADAAVFRLAAGSYYALFRNTGDASAVLTVETQRSRGNPSSASLAVVRVFYATDRERLRTNDVAFGGEPGALSYGHADVTLPRAVHHMGELEGPSIWRLEFSANPAKHVVMRSPVTKSQQDFLAAVNERVKASGRRECLVFVHGYNVSFEDAVRRTGQIAYDLAFDGAPILFSWPSQGSVMPLNSYGKDERNARLSVDSLHQLFSLLASQTPNLTIHVVAHSMGGRVVHGALEQFAAQAPKTRVKSFREVALFAPDIDAELFRRAAGKLAGVAERLTLYASSNDSALTVSQQAAGYKRAGQAGPDLVVTPGVDTIDATQVDTSVLGLQHLYYADSSTILSDLFQLLRGRSPAERGPRLESVGVPPAVFWRFRPAAR